MLLAAFELSPSWPYSLYPQQYALFVASVVIAQVWCWPALIAVIIFPLKTPAVKTATGMFLLVIELSPSWPSMLLPQQYALFVASVVIAQVCLSPALIAVIIFPLKTPAVKTATGMFLLIFELSPSWPVAFLPQQYALFVASVVIAQV
jgi:FtsH-binding integral membrane protein